MDTERLETLEDIVDWQRKVRSVDANLHAVFAARDREAKRKKSRLGLPYLSGAGLKKQVKEGPLPSGY